MKSLRWIVAACLAVVASACTVIEPSAARVARDAGGDGASTVGSADADTDVLVRKRCRVVPRRFDADLVAVIVGSPPAQALCISNAMNVPGGADAGLDALLFCVVGDLSSVSTPKVITLEGKESDLTTCAYCTMGYAGCHLVGTKMECSAHYALVSGHARLVRFGTSVGDSVWIDVGATEMARIVRRNGLVVGEIDPNDCLFFDAITVQAKVQQGTLLGCTDPEDTVCALARTAGGRVP